MRARDVCVCLKRHDMSTQCELDLAYVSGIREELDLTASMPDLQDVKEAYQKKYGACRELIVSMASSSLDSCLPGPHVFHVAGRSLEADVAADTSGNYKATLLKLLQAPADSAAEDFHYVIEVYGTDCPLDWYSRADPIRAHAVRPTSG